MRAWLLILSLATSACSPARLVGPQPLAPPVRAPPIVLVLEPFFETSATERRQVTERVQGLHGPRTRETVIVREVEEKPLYARVPSLELQHRLVLDELRRLRPDWEVVSTGHIDRLRGPVRLVRVVVGDSETLDSDRALKSVATAVGIVIWPLLLVNLQPVREVSRVHGTLTVYDADAESLVMRRLRYATQPDFAVDTRGLRFEHRPFALDVPYEEGLFANQDRRGPVLLRGFSERLAAAVVSLLEGVGEGSK